MDTTEKQLNTLIEQLKFKNKCLQKLCENLAIELIKGNKDKTGIQLVAEKHKEYYDSLIMGKE